MLPRASHTPGPPTPAGETVDTISGAVDPPGFRPKAPAGIAIQLAAIANAATATIAALATMRRHDFGLLSIKVSSWARLANDQLPADAAAGNANIAAAQAADEFGFRKKRTIRASARNNSTFNHEWHGLYAHSPKYSMDFSKLYYFPRFVVNS
jgi:hypothetical protein